jgi:hypothetical protein
MSLFSNPRPFSSFKECRLYSVEWARETLIGYELDYHVISKVDQGSYLDYGSFSSLSEAFSVRRSLASQHPSSSFFLRASKRLYKFAEGDACCDLWRDAFNTGSDHLIPADQLSDYKQWASEKVRSRSIYAKTDRDAPKF